MYIIIGTRNRKGNNAHCYTRQLCAPHNRRLGAEWHKTATTPSRAPPDAKRAQLRRAAETPARGLGTRTRVGIARRGRNATLKLRPARATNRVEAARSRLVARRAAPDGIDKMHKLIANPQQQPWPTSRRAVTLIAKRVPAEPRSALALRSETQPTDSPQTSTSEMTK